MLHSGDLDFSFSGLKTETLYTVRDMDETTVVREQANLAASFQQTVVEALIAKTVKAVEQYAPRTVVLAGGVAANEQLRAQLTVALSDRDTHLRVAPLELCGDNAVMIGQVGAIAFEAGRTTDWQTIDAMARMPIDGWV
jgi:N6-L-threonylcarbamoyladenine synthase